MYRIAIALFLLTFLGCQSKDRPDTRPKSQKAIIEIIRLGRDSVNSAGEDESARRQRVESGVNRLKSHIRDSLALSIKSWEARVLDLKTDPSDPGKLTVSFGMNLDGTENSEKSRYSSLVLSSLIPESHPLSAELKQLELGEIVQLDGKFKTVQNSINIESYHQLKRSKNVLDNPEFRVDLFGIKKLEE